MKRVLPKIKVIFITLLTLLATVGQSQIIDIEDPDFLEALIDEGVDLNFDGQIQVSEAALIINLDISGKDFASIKGIEEFPNLKSLTIYNNDYIGTMDATTILPYLEELTMANCPKLKEVNVISHQYIKKLTLIGNPTNVGKKSSLIDLKIIDLPNLNELTISFQDSLEILELDQLNNLAILTFFADKALDSLDISNLPNIENLSLSSRVLSQLRTGYQEHVVAYTFGLEYIDLLQIDSFPSLIELRFSSPYAEIQQIQIDGHQNLEMLWIENYFSTIKVSLKNLPSLHECVFKQFYELKIIELDSLPSLEEIHLKEISADFHTLKITNSRQLKELSSKSDYLSNLVLDNLPAIESINIKLAGIEILDLSSFTNLKDLNIISESLQQLYCNNTSNENLNCDCPALAGICSDENDDFENIPPTTIINTFCAFTSQGLPYQLNGHIRYDYGQNSCDSLAIHLPYVNLDVYDNQKLLGRVISNGAGLYGLYHPLDTMIVLPSQNSFNNAFNFIPDSILYEFTDSITLITQDYCLLEKDMQLDVEVALNPPIFIRPGEEINYKIFIRNKGSIRPEGNIMLIFEDDFLEHIDITPSPISVDSNFVTWDIPFLLPFQDFTFEISFYHNTPMDSFPLNNGDTLAFELKTNINTETVDSSFSSFYYIPVRNSFDPNDKSCLQGSRININSLEDYLLYKIRFENLGSAEALNVVIQDTLNESDFNVSTFEIIDASHEVSATLMNNVVSFKFIGINLPHTGSNDGYVLYKIQPNDNLQIGDTIENKASIYFDYNFPIHTNNAQTIIVDELNTSVHESANIVDLRIFPNVANHYIWIENNFDVPDAYLCDLNGERFKIQILADNKVSVSHLTPGIYFIIVVDGNRIYQGKFVKI